MAVSYTHLDVYKRQAIQILQGGKLKEHITKTPALLICMEGEVIFENEKGIKTTLFTGDYVNIEPVSYTHLDVYKRQEYLCAIVATCYAGGVEAQKLDVWAAFVLV